MLRFSGDGWKSGWRLAVIANDALGNFVVCTPLLQMLRAHAPASIHYFGGARTRELQEASDLAEWTYPLHGTSLGQAARDVLPASYDLVINVESSSHAKAFASLLCAEDTRVCGPCLGADGRGDLPFTSNACDALWTDPEWVSSGLVARHPTLQSGFIAEILARACGLKGPVPRYSVPRADPEREIPDVLVACAASLPEKLWPLESWRLALGHLRDQGLSIGLLGAPPKVQAAHWKGDGVEDTLVAEGLVRDLRGVFTLPQVVGALGAARAVLTLDNGILHLAAAAGAPTVGLFREGIHRLWCPPDSSVRVVVPAVGDPVASIDPAAVRRELAHVL